MLMQRRRMTVRADRDSRCTEADGLTVGTDAGDAVEFERVAGTDAVGAPVGLEAVKDEDADADAGRL